MDKFDKQRIENAIWTLLQYHDEIVNSSDEMKIDRYEVESMFKTLYHVLGLCTKNN